MVTVARDRHPAVVRRCRPSFDRWSFALPPAWPGLQPAVLRLVQV